MSEEDARMAITIAIIVNLDKLPQLKGKGVRREERQPGIERFARAVADHILGGDACLMRGPQRPLHSIG